MRSRVVVEVLTALEHRIPEQSKAGIVRFEKKYARVTSYKKVLVQSTN